MADDFSHLKPGDEVIVRIDWSGGDEWGPPDDHVLTKIASVDEGRIRLGSSDWGHLAGTAFWVADGRLVEREPAYAANLIPVTPELRESVIRSRLIAHILVMANDQELLKLSTADLTQIREILDAATASEANPDA